MMTDKEKIISFETAKLAKEKGYMSDIIKLEKQELQNWLSNNGILVLVDYEYECDSTPYFYKIYKFVDEHGKPERWPIKGVRYDDDGTEITDIVGYRNYKRSYGDYKSYSDALDAGLQEGLSMIEVNERKIEDITVREISVKNGTYIEKNNGIININ